ncbi:MFS transporter [Actinomadura sp. DC4]|uniref:MFS transporter n=1 Tax=Actinomadura sp. DC4 TaxID=3055069 RepID=UPI0025B0A698|nr:MFS transporter [Actinomadura sp. DC4]MDN3359975.1 MFS transporter [Actinomadura sp. DC4]
MKPPAEPPPSLWRDGDFRRLWTGHTASQLGAQTGQVVLPLIAVIALGAGTQQVGALRAAQQAPILLLSLFAGAWVDGRRSRTVMVLADLGRTVALATVSVAYALGGLGIPLLLLVAFLVGSLSVYFDVAYQTSLVRLVRRDQLAQGNSTLEGSRSAAQIAGPALGGALVSLLTAPVAITASAFFFALSSLSIRRIPEPRPGPRRKHVWRQIHEGLRLVAGDASLRAVGIASALFQFSFAALMTVYLLFLPRTLHLPGAAVGLALAAMGPGALVGSLLSAALPRRYGHGVVLISAATLADGTMLCVPALHGDSTATIAALMAVNFLFGVFSQLVDVTVVTVRQALTPIPVQGRVVATINFVGMGLTPLGSLLGGYLAGALGVRAALLSAAAALALSPLSMAVSPLARLGKDLPA